MSVIPNSILACVDAEIDSCLFSYDQLQNGYRYEQKRSCNDLSKSPPVKFDGKGLIDSIYGRIEKKLMRRPNRKPSKENWKLTAGDNQKAITENIREKKNKSNEVTLERAIVEKWPEQWIYQMSVASGLFGATTDKRRAVDLVHNHRNGHYDFVELKIESNKSDTPLYAAMEILGYGLVYLASRRDAAKNLKYVSEELPVLEASEIHLCVLAPENYYKKHNLNWLQNAINDGLKQFDDTDLRIRFRFEQFLFPWNYMMSASDLPQDLFRKSVY